MDTQSTEFKSLIYDLKNGSLDLKYLPVGESKYVENEYEEGNQGLQKNGILYIACRFSYMLFFLQTSARCC